MISQSLDFFIMSCYALILLSSIHLGFLYFSILLVLSLLIYVVNMANHTRTRSFLSLLVFSISLLVILYSYIFQPGPIVIILTLATVVGFVLSLDLINSDVVIKKNIALKKNYA